MSSHERQSFGAGVPGLQVHYIPPPDGFSQIGPAFFHQYMASKNKWADELLKRQLDAQDPQTQINTLLALEQMEARERANIAELQAQAAESGARASASIGKGAGIDLMDAYSVSERTTATELKSQEQAREARKFAESRLGLSKEGSSAFLRTIENALSPDPDEDVAHKLSRLQGVRASLAGEDEQPTFAALQEARALLLGSGHYTAADVNAVLGAPSPTAAPGGGVSTAGLEQLRDAIVEQALMEHQQRQIVPAAVQSGAVRRDLSALRRSALPTGEPTSRELILDLLEHPSIGRIGQTRGLGFNMDERMARILGRRKAPVEPTMEEFGDMRTPELLEELLRSIGPTPQFDEDIVPTVAPTKRVKPATGLPATPTEAAPEDRLGTSPLPDRFERFERLGTSPLPIAEFDDPMFLRLQTSPQPSDEEEREKAFDLREMGVDPETVLNAEDLEILRELGLAPEPAAPMTELARRKQEAALRFIEEHDPSYLVPTSTASARLEKRRRQQGR